MHGRAYVAMLKRLKNAKGRKYSNLRRKASAVRKSLIRARARNRWHPEERNRRKYDTKALLRQMPKSYREMLAKVTRTKQGRAALQRYRAFTGLPFPPEIKVVTLPGPKNKTTVLVGMGKAPVLNLADGNEKTHRRVRKVRKSGLLATDATGRRMMILSGRGAGKRGSKGLRFLGYAPETHYVLTRGEENAGTFKKGKYWVHEHSDEGGRWPKVYQDAAGNIVYGPGTYRVGKWIRRN